MANDIVDIVLASIVALCATTLFAVGIVISAFGARMWADATAAVHRARAHGAEADTTIATTVALADDGEQRPRARAAYVPPEDQDIVQSILSMRNEERKRGQEREYDTLSNEGFEPEPPIPAGGFYATGERQ